MDVNDGMQFNYFPQHVDKQGNVRRVASVHKDGQRIARMSLLPETGEIDRLYVAEDHRRQGLATHLYNYMKELSERQGVPGPKHSSRMTKAGMEWAQSVGGQMPEKIHLEEEQI